MSTDLSIVAHEEVRDLISEGRELGAVAQSRISEVIESVELSEEQYEALLQVLADLNIEVLGETTPAPTPEDPTPRVDLSVRATSNDPVRMYLREIGKV